MDCECQTKKEEIYTLKYIVSEISTISIRFHKIVFLCEYQLMRLAFIYMIFAIDEPTKSKSNPVQKLPYNNKN
jgi:hypothetical protein